MVEDDLQQGGRVMSKHTTDANARLIAAAPDLLAACQEFMSLFHDSDMRPEDECHELAATVRAAIAKATGE